MAKKDWSENDKQFRGSFYYGTRPRGFGLQYIKCPACERFGELQAFYTREKCFSGPNKPQHWAFVPKGYICKSCSYVLFDPSERRDE